MRTAPRRRRRTATARRTPIDLRRTVAGRSRRRSASGPASGARARSACSYVTIHGYRRAYVKAGAGRRCSSSTASATAPTPGGRWSSNWPSTTRSSRRTCSATGARRSRGPTTRWRGYANGMRDLLSVLEVDRVTVVGHSLGGGVAAQFAYQFPERCERLVLVGSGGVGRTVSPLLRVAAVPGVEALMPLPRPAARPLRQPPRRRAAAHLRHGARARRRGDPGRVRRAPQHRGPPGHPAHAALGRRLAAARSSPCWTGPTWPRGCPTLIVWGRRDAIIPLGHGRLVHAAMPGQRARDLRRGGSLPAPHRPGALRARRRASSWQRTDAGALRPAHDWRERLRRGERAPRPTSKTPRRAAVGAAPGRDGRCRGRRVERTELELSTR